MKQNTSVQWSRIRNLLRYDWAVDKSKITFILAIILGLYAALFIMAYWNQTSMGLIPLTVQSGESLVTFANVSVMNYFEYATMIVGILTTVILHRKFTNPQTSLQYLALPGSRLEKYIVMLADFAIVVIGMQLLYLAVYAVSMLICQLTYPEFSWWMNPYDSLNMAEKLMRVTESGENEIDVMHTSVMQLFIRMAPVMSFGFFGLWCVVNMLFKHNGILKSIGIFLLAYVFLVIVSMIIVVGIVASVADQPELHAPYLHTLATALKVILWLQIPLALLFQWVFYRQIANKQAK